MSVQDELNDFNERFQKAMASGDVAAIVDHFAPTASSSPPGRWCKEPRP